MKKKLQFLLIILACCLTTVVYAQDFNGFYVKFSVLDATCYNNGKVVYALTDSLGGVLDSLPPNFSQVRVYYKLTNGDSVHYAGWYYSGGTDTLTVNYGTYVVGVEALLSDSTGGYVRVDTQTVLNIATTYQKPTAAVVPYEVRLRNSGAGTLSALPCADIGRVQLRILYGRFPYNVTVTDQNTGDTLRTAVFHDRQYWGNNESYYNYRDYYSIDSLPGGNWAFQVEDGCGYGLPKIVQTVQTESLQTPLSIGVYASSGNFADSNVVKLSVAYRLSVEGLQDLMHQYVSYRFTYGGIMTGEWHPMPYDPTATNQYCLYDTAWSVGKYCDLWDRDITFEYRVSGCGSMYTKSSFQYHAPNEIYFAKDSADVTDSVRMEEWDCAREEFWRRDNHSIRYYNSVLETSQYEPDYLNVFGDHFYHRYHYTHPLTWVYTDVRTGAVVKFDTVAIITDRSSLTYSEVDSLYGIPHDSVIAIPVERKLLDGKGCELYVTVDTLRYMRSSSREVVCWQVAYHDDESKCCTSPRWVRVYRATNFGAPADGTIIRLVRSPLNNRYNFEALYHAADRSWTIVRDNVDNTAAITGAANGLELIISDYCLPSGPYEFEVITSCGTNRVSEKAVFSDYMEMRVEEPIAFAAERNCGNLDIHYHHGSFQWVRTNTSPETGLPTDTVFQSVPMKATVVSAPSASLLGLELYSQPHFTLTVPGTYVIRICPNLAVDVCSSGSCHYDTFDLDAATVEFEEAFAVVCDTSSTEGSAWVRASHGMPPYTYTLFDQPDKQGNILAINDSGVFPDIPLRSNQTLSCLVQDSCNAYFHVNFQPRTMADLQKLWFDGGVSATAACEGTTIQVHALAVGDIWQYEWSGPDGFTATTPDPYVFVPRGHGDGWYKVTIRQTSCASEIRDSIHLTVLPAPTLALAPDTTVCPGEAMEVRFTPHSDVPASDISFSVAFATPMGTRIRHYSAASGMTVKDTFSTVAPAKIYPVSIRDGRCEYSFADPDDTIYINLRTDVLQACNIVTNFDTVCYGGDARLAAKAVDSAPYVIRWFGDYNQTQLLKIDTISETGRWSRYDTAGIFHRTLLYASLQKEGICPSVNGLTDSVMNMRNGETVLACGRHIRLFDSGGSGEGSSSGEHLVHRFRTSDGTRVSIHFDETNLAESACLQVFSGEEAIADSLLLVLTSRSHSSQTVVSSSNVLTVCFSGQKTLNSNWSAVVEAAPGIAVADVWTGKIKRFTDEVCQSQTNSYDDPYGMVPDIVSAEDVSRALRKAGNYYFVKSFPSADGHGCDSTVEFRLTVNPPQMVETSVTAIRPTGYLWHDSLYLESGRYARFTTDVGCDRFDVLELTIVDANCRGGEICLGDSLTLTLSAHISSSSHDDLRLPRKARPGDVLCTDGAILPIDTFLISGKSAKGVVFHVDETGIHGLAVALAEVNRPFLQSPPLFILTQPCYSISTAVLDIDGESNTLNMKVIDDAYGGWPFASDGTAVSYCYFFNHNTLSADYEPHGWFLPSFTEINLLHGNVMEVKRSMSRLCQHNSAFKSFGLDYYWCSTLNSSNQAWLRAFSGWTVGSIYASYGVRPVTRF